MFLLEFISHPVYDDVIEVIATKTVITGCSQYFECAVSQIKDRDIECTTAKVEYQDSLFLVGLVDTECQSCSSRFVDYSFNLETGDLAGILGCLSLRIVEICRNGDDGFCDRFTKIIFCILLHVLKDHSRDFLRCIVPVVYMNFFI